MTMENFTGTSVTGFAVATACMVDGCQEQTQMEAHMHGNDIILPTRRHHCVVQDKSISHLSCDVVLYGSSSSTSLNGRMTVPVGNLALTISVATLRVVTVSERTHPVRESTT
jgi:hypothetical protein